MVKKRTHKELLDIYKYMYIYTDLFVDEKYGKLSLSEKKDMFVCMLMQFLLKNEYEQINSNFVWGPEGESGPLSKFNIVFEKIE